MMRLGRTIPAIILVLIPNCSSAVFEKELYSDIIISSMPAQWKLLQKTSGGIPWGHYSWTNKYSGEAGMSVVIQGPQDVIFHWFDKDGQEHKEALAKEILEIWVMPPGYHDTWKSYLNLERAIPAELVYSGKHGVVYGHPSHRIISEDQFKDRLKVARQTSWPDSPHNDGSLSWKKWETDIAQNIKLQEH